MRKPDLTAPRFRYKFDPVLSSKLTKAFKEKYPQYKGYSDKILINAIKEHNKLIADQIVSSRDGIELPLGIGTLFIGTVPPRESKSINYKKSIELGMKVYHKNWETDNKLGKIFYSNYSSKYKFEGRHLWFFTGVRQLKRKVAKEYPKQWQKFVVMDSFKNIWGLFGKTTYRDHARARTKQELKVYNEFE